MLRRDLAEHLLGVGARDLERHAALARARAAIAPSHARVREHDLLDLVRAGCSVGPSTTFSSRYRKIRIERRTLRATASCALGAALGDEARRSIGSPTLTREVAIGGEERRDLREVRGPRRRAVGEVQEAPLAARALAPEQRERHERARASRRPTPRAPPPRAGRARSLPLRDARAARAASEPSRAVRRNRKSDCPPRASCARTRSRSRSETAPRPRAQRAAAIAQRLEQRPVVVEADAVGEAREPQPLAQEQRVEQEVVEPARVAHHVDDAAARARARAAARPSLVEVEVRRRSGARTSGRRS